MAAPPSAIRKESRGSASGSPLRVDPRTSGDPRSALAAVALLGACGRETPDADVEAAEHEQRSDVDEQGQQHPSQRRTQQARHQNRAGAETADDAAGVEEDDHFGDNAQRP